MINRAPLLFHSIKASIRFLDNSEWANSNILKKAICNRKARKQMVYPAKISALIIENCLRCPFE